jgi:hypothetical protein
MAGLSYKAKSGSLLYIAEIFFYSNLVYNTAKIRDMKL